MKSIIIYNIMGICPIYWGIMAKLNINLYTKRTSFRNQAKNKYAIVENRLNINIQ